MWMPCVPGTQASGSGIGVKGVRSDMATEREGSSEGFTGEKRWSSSALGSVSGQERDVGGLCWVRRNGEEGMSQHL